MESTAVLTDGTVVQLRHIRPDDADRLTTFHTHLSPETIRRRYFTPHPLLSADELHRFTHVDGDQRLALVALCGDEIVGVGRYESLGGTDDVEGAWVIRDDFQGRGLGRRLAIEIADQARAHGKLHLLAETLAENIPMRRTLLGMGLPVVVRFQDGIVEVVVTLVTEPAESC